MGCFAIDREYLNRLLGARDTLCGFCEVDECDKCIVTHLIDDAYNEMPEEGDDSFEPTVVCDFSGADWYFVDGQS